MEILLSNRLNADQQLNAVLRAFHDIIFVLDGRGTILDYKASDPGLYFASPEQVLQRKVYDILPSKVGSSFEEAIQKILKTGEAPAVEYSFPTESGERWYEARLVPFSPDQVMAFVRDVTTHKQAEVKIQRQLQQLAALRSIDLAIASGLDLKLLLSMLLSHVTAQLQVDAASILLLDANTHTLEFAAGLGFRTSALQHTRLRLGEGFAGQAAIERKVINVPDLNGQAGFSHSPMFYKENFSAYYAVPLIAKGQVRGVFEIFHRASLSPDADWLNFLHLLAGQAAIAIDNAMMFKDLQRSNAELKLAYDATIEGWSRTLDLRGKETEGHTRRVADATVQLASNIGVSESELVHIRRGAILHDIGKVAIPDHILFKPGPLSQEEWEIMRHHPNIASDLLTPVSYLAPALDIPRYHHEKWDGSGYPNGLKGEQIPLAARLFSIVDVYDCLTSDRPFRTAWSKDSAIDYIKEQSGKYFDPKAVPPFLSLVDNLGYN